MIVCVNATKIVLTNSSSSNTGTIYRDNVDMTLASSVYSELYDDGAANTTSSKLRKALAGVPPFTCANIDLSSRGIWYCLSTKGLSGLSSTCYNLTAHTLSLENVDLKLGVFQGDSCPVPLDPSTLDSSNGTKLYTYGTYDIGYNNFVNNTVPYSCVAQSFRLSSTITLPIDSNETYFIYVGSSNSPFGNVSLSIMVRTRN
jgi:hypothetical protein